MSVALTDMIFFKNSQPLIALVCCIHGDELFGEIVYEHFRRRIPRTPGLALLLANQQALARRRRFLECDLNRSFPGNEDSPRFEERLAAQVLAALHLIPIVLDVHTTTTDLELVAITARIDNGVRRVVNALPIRDIAVMPPNLANRSLIGNVQHGVSLEFGREFAQEQGIEVLSGLINSLLLGDVHPRRERRLFGIEGALPLHVDLPRNAANLRKVRNRALYPFLHGEKAYTDHRGFYATAYARRRI